MASSSLDGLNWRAFRIASLIDTVLILTFVIIGRSSHDEQLDVEGILSTWWPFLAGNLVAVIVTRSWRAPFRIFWTGVASWAVTVAVAMLLRLVSGQGVEVGFVIVATLFLALFLLGWRALVLLVRRRNAQTPARDEGQS